MKHPHFAERCEHGETRRTLCDHQVPWSAYRTRQVPCAPAFCRLARRVPSGDRGEGQDASRARALEGEEGEDFDPDE